VRVAIVAKLGWKVVGGASGLVAGLVTRKLLDNASRSVKGGTPPTNPKQVDVSWQEAVSWTVASTAGVAVARLLAARAAAGAWEKATGSVPPGLEVPPDVRPA